MKLDIGHQRQRFQEAVAKAYVAKPGLRRLDQQRHMVEIRTKAAVRAPYARGKLGDMEIQAAEQRGKTAVQFVTKAPTMLAHDFVEDALFIKHDRALEVDIEILEGNGEQVRAMDLAKDIGSRVAWAVVSDSVEISGRVHEIIFSFRTRKGAMAASSLEIPLDCFHGQEQAIAAQWQEAELLIESDYMFALSIHYYRVRHDHFAGFQAATQRINQEKCP